MSARADNFDLICDALAMSAAVFRFFGGNAVTGSVSAFLGVCHDPPLPLRPDDQGDFGSRVRCGIMGERQYRLSSGESWEYSPELPPHDLVPDEFERKRRAPTLRHLCPKTRDRRAS